LGILGRTLITLGLLILAFVVYQLWGTSIEFRANQSDLASEFRKAAASTASTTPPAGPVTTTPTGVPATSSGAPTTAAAGASTTTEPAATTTTPAETTATPRWDVVAALKMPTISDSTLYIVNGVSTGDLKRGIGHYPGTAKPGEYGNFALAGHRTTYGAPFENLDRLQPGDRVIVDSIDGGHYEYVVESQEIIGPDEVRVLSRPRNPLDAVLTLTTCHPKRSTAKRLVVHARLDAAASTPLKGADGASPPTNPGTTPAPTTLPVSSTTTAGAAVPSTTSPVATSPATTASASTVPATTSPATTPATTPAETVPLLAGDEVSEPAAEALSTGWFDDAAAWPQIILWALPLIALGLLGRLLGKRWKRWWLGSLAVAAPFVVVLYFFFQNVNRLLPPGL